MPLLRRSNGSRPRGGTATTLSYTIIALSSGEFSPNDKMFAGIVGFRDRRHDEGIPERWIERLARREALEDMADRLASAAFRR